MLNRMRPNTWWSRLLWIVATYVVASDVLPNLLLVLINSIGYLPYSDRPGPGWQTPHLPRIEELKFFYGFSLLLLKGSAFYGLLFAGAALVLAFCKLPRWALRVFATPTAFLASGLMMAAAGWMIAISSLGVYVAAGCGALWGLFVFPKLVPRMARVFPIAVRVAIPIVLFVGSTYWLIKPMLPDHALTNAKIEVIRQGDSGVDLSHLNLDYVGPSIGREVKGTGKYRSVMRMSFTSDNRNQLRVLLIIDDTQPVAHTFRLPRTGDAIYRQSHGSWKQELSEGRSSEISLELNPDSGEAGVNLQVQGPCCSDSSQSFAPYE